MKFYFLALLFFGLETVQYKCFSQKVYKVIDKNTLQPVELVSMKAVGNGYITFSDTNGEVAPSNSTSTYILSHVSYVSDTITLDKLKSNVISLCANVTSLNSVAVTNQNGKSYTEEVGIMNSVIVGEHQISNNLDHAFILRNNASYQSVLNSVSFYLRNVSLHSFVITITIKPIGLISKSSIDYSKTFDVKFRRKNGWLKMGFSQLNIPIFSDALVIFNIAENRLLGEEEKDVYIGISNKYLNEASMIRTKSGNWSYLNDYFNPMFFDKKTRNYILKAELESIR